MPLFPLCLNLLSLLGSTLKTTADISIKDELTLFPCKKIDYFLFPLTFFLVELKKCKGSFGKLSKIEGGYLSNKNTQKCRLRR